MQFKLLVVNNRNQSKWAMINPLWLVINVGKLATVNLLLPIWIDYHFYYYQFESYLTNLPNLLNDLTHH